MSRAIRLPCGRTTVRGKQPIRAPSVAAIAAQLEELGQLTELPSAQDDDLSARILDSGSSLDDVEARVLNHAVARAGGNLSQAARLLGLSRAQLAYRQKRSLERDQDRPPAAG